MRILPFPTGLRSFHDAYFARHVIFYGPICAVRESLGTYTIHDSNDYGFKPTRTLTDERLERSIAEAAVLCESFNRRCDAFGIPRSAARFRIQNFTSAAMQTEKHRRQGKLHVLIWLARNQMALGLKERAHLLMRVLLPPRVATFVNSRLFVVE
jgi:hypothetical protein